MEEEIIKKDIVHYRGGEKPYISTAYGYLKLTKSKLFLDYYLLSIPAVKKVYGILKRRIQIPIKNIKDVKKFLDILIVSYVDNSKTKKVYLGFWKVFKTGIYTLKLCNEWIEAINKLRK